MTTYATEWRAASACLSADPELFFPVAQGSAADGQTSSALQVCASCTVRQQCLDFAMTTGEAHGIWAAPRPTSGSGPGAGRCAAARGSGPARRHRTLAPHDRVMFGRDRVGVPT